VELKSKEPSHGTSPTLGKSLKGLVDQYPLVAADTQGSRIDKADARTGAQQDFLDKNGQWKQHLLFQFHEAVVGYALGKQVRQMFAHIFLIVMLEASETARMKQNKDNHYFRIAHPVRFVTVFMLLVVNHIFFLLQRKFFAKIICHTINLCNFRL